MALAPHTTTAPRTAGEARTGPAISLPNWIVRVRAGITAAAIAAPTFGTLLTLFLYMRKESYGFSAGEVLVWGAIGALGAWALMAIGLAARATPRGANPVFGSHIETRLRSIRDNLNTIVPDSGGNVLGQPWANTRRQLDKEIDEVSTYLAAPNVDWFSGTAFLAAWRMVHHLEGELILYMPAHQVVAEGLFDHSRLRGSKIEDGEIMAARLKVAMIALDPTVGPYLEAPNRCPRDVSKDSAPESPDPAAAERTARVVIADVRRKINGYRDERWGAVVRQKQQFLSAALSLSLGAYVFTVIAVVRAAPEEALVGGAVFFGVGAMAGLLAQLVVVRDTTPLVDDYGYNKTRLAFTPLVSGVAALVGVWILASSVTLTVDPDSGSGDPETREVPSLSAVFDFTDNRASLIVAAAFGIAPAAAINRIQQGVADAKRDLQNTGAPGSRSDANLLN